MCRKFLFPSIFDHGVGGTHPNLGQRDLFPTKTNVKIDMLSSRVKAFVHATLDHGVRETLTSDSGTFSSLSVFATSCFRTVALRRRSTNGASMPLTSRTLFWRAVQCSAVPRTEGEAGSRAGKETEHVHTRALRQQGSGCCLVSGVFIVLAPVAFGCAFECVI